MFRGCCGRINRFEELEPGSSSAYRLLQRTLPIKQSGGRQGDWDTDPNSSVNACKRLKDRLNDLDALVTEELTQIRQSALTGILNALQQFALGFAQERKGQGKAGFHDLLVWARNLLRDDIGVRDHFRRRFSHLLIDEAQDTDPIQAEIAMFIAEEHDTEHGAGASADSRPTSWQDVFPRAG